MHATSSLRRAARVDDTAARLGAAIGRGVNTTGYVVFQKLIDLE